MPTIHLTDGQAKALLEHGQHGSRPATLNGKGRIALGRAMKKLKNAVEDIEYGEFKADLDEFKSVLLDARKRPFVDAMHLRLRDLLTVAKLWTAAESLPTYVHAVLKVDRLADPEWPALVLGLLDEHGVEVDLPRDELDEEDCE